MDLLYFHLLPWLCLVICWSAGAVKSSHFNFWFILKANHWEPISLSWHVPDKTKYKVHLELGHWQLLVANYAAMGADGRKVWSCCSGQPLGVPASSTTAILQVAKCTWPPGLYQLSQWDIQLFVKYMQERDCVFLCKMYRESNLNLHYSSFAIYLTGCI